MVSHAGGNVVLDAGSKALGADRAAGPPATAGCSTIPTPGSSRSPSTTPSSPGRTPLPPLGSRVRVVPNHVCNAVNLADAYVLTDGGTWPVAARGRNN